MRRDKEAKLISSTIENVPRNSCTGCALCEAQCPTKAISMHFAAGGFKDPVVDSSLCIKCGRCLKNCPAINPVTVSPIKEYALCQAKDSLDLSRSSSGAVFYVLASEMIARGGYVAGCIFDEKYLPMHVVTNKLEDVKRMQGSKYAQSYLSRDVFDQIKWLVSSGAKVLFAGTPCQVAAVRRFTDDNENLIPIDLICHGVGSPGLWLHHRRKLEKKLGNAVDIRFRDKDKKGYPKNCRLTVLGKKGIYSRSSLQDPYYAAFTQARIFRESCYECRYACKDRVGFLTLGDYLPNGDIPSTMVRKRGIGLVCINEDRGSDLMNSIADSVIAHRLTTVPAKRNLTRPEPRPSVRNELDKCFVASDGEVHGDKLLKITLSDFIKRWMPGGLKKAIKKLSKA